VECDRSSLNVIDLGRRRYGPVLRLQEQLVAARKDNQISDTLLLVEHEPVYTLGRNADEHHVLLSAEALARSGIELVRTTRGGDVTYHGPGQCVGYPILDLASRHKRVLWYIDALEQVLIRTLADLGIEASTDRINRGVWVGFDKIAAIGVRVTGNVTMHGFALNVRTDLADYGGIVPCGIRGRGVTSVHKWVPDIAMDKVKCIIVSRFCEFFDLTAVQGRLPEVLGIDGAVGEEQ